MTDYPELPEFDPERDQITHREVVEHQSSITDRSTARRLALQALYELDSTAHDIGDVITYHTTSHDLRQAIRDYTVFLVRGVRRAYFQLDEVLQRYAPEWPLQQVATIDRNILRIALYEMIFEARMPVGVAIDEAVELAKVFGAEGTTRFVNGVLGTIANNLDDIRVILLVNEDGEE